MKILIKFYWFIKIIVNYCNNLYLNIYNKFFRRIDVSSSFLFPLVLSKLNVKIPDGADNLVNYSFSIFLLSLVGLFCLLNIGGYLISFILINKYKDKISNTYLIIKKIIRYYENTSLFFVAFEIFTCALCLLIMLFSSLFILGIIVIK